MHRCGSRSQEQGPCQRAQRALAHHVSTKIRQLGDWAFFTRMQACLLLRLCFGFNEGAGAPCLRARVLGSLAVYVVEGHSQGRLSWEAGP